MDSIFKMSAPSLILSLGLLIASCSGHFHSPESMNDKMNRFKPRSYSVNTVPRLHVANDLSYKNFEDTNSDQELKLEQDKPLANRGPASTKIQSNKNEELKNFSNRHLYFLTLHDQYLYFQTFLDHSNIPKINFCPAFHTSFIQNRQNQQGLRKQAYQPHESINIKNLTLPETLTRFPELSLPITKTELTPTIADYFQGRSQNYKNDKDGTQFRKDLQNMMKQSLQIHLSKTYHELNELCEYGQSENYYIYENLISHARRSPSHGPNSESMKTLLLTTIFANMALTHSLNEQATQTATSSSSRRSPASATPREKDHSLATEQEVLERMNSKWVKSYFEKVFKTH